MKKTLEYILSSIVTNPDAIEIDEREENGVVYETISVAKEDVGKVIGKNGRIIRALRNVMKIPAVKQNKKVFIQLADQPQ